MGWVVASFRRIFALLMKNLLLRKRRPFISAFVTVAPSLVILAVAFLLLEIPSKPAYEEIEYPLEGLQYENYNLVSSMQYLALGCGSREYGMNGENTENRHVAVYPAAFGEELKSLATLLPTSGGIDFTNLFQGYDSVEQIREKYKPQPFRTSWVPSEAAHVDVPCAGMIFDEPSFGTTRPRISIYDFMSSLQHYGWRYYIFQKPLYLESFRNYAALQQVANYFVAFKKYPVTSGGTNIGELMSLPASPLVFQTLTPRRKEPRQGIDLGIALMIATYIPKCLLLEDLHYEKSNKLILILDTFGVTCFEYYISWFITYLCLDFMNVALSTLFAVLIGFRNSSFMLIAALLYVHTFILTVAAFFVSTLIPSVVVDQLALLLMVLAGPLMIYISSPLDSYVVRIIKQILPSYGPSRIFYWVQDLEHAGFGLNWKQFTAGQDKLRYAEVSIELLVIFFVFTILFAGTLHFLCKIEHLQVLPMISKYLRNLGNTAKVSSLFQEDEKEEIFCPREIPNLDDSSRTHVRVRKLYKKYKTLSGFTPALIDVNLDVKRGCITVLLGRNGAGKSTFFSLLQGAVFQDYGDISISGKRHPKDSNEIKKKLGVCPQYSSLWGNLTINDHFDVFSFLELGTSDMTTKAKLAAYVGLDTKLFEKVRNLSGGMQRRVSFILSFIVGKELILLDEPTSGLDPMNRRAIWSAIAKLKTGRSILISTHYMDEAEVLGDQIAVLEQGNLRAFGSPFFLKKHFECGYELTLEKGNGFSEHSAALALGLKKISEDCVTFEENNFRLKIAISHQASRLMPQILDFLYAQDSAAIRRFSFSCTGLNKVLFKVSNFCPKVCQVDEYQSNTDENKWNILSKGDILDDNSFVEQSRYEKLSKSFYITFYLYFGLFYRYWAVHSRSLTTLLQRLFLPIFVMFLLSLPYFIVNILPPEFKVTIGREAVQLYGNTNNDSLRLAAYGGLAFENISLIFPSGSGNDPNASQFYSDVILVDSSTRSAEASNINFLSQGNPIIENLSESIYSQYEASIGLPGGSFKMLLNYMAELRYHESNPSNNWAPQVGGYCFFPPLVVTSPSPAQVENAATAQISIKRYGLLGDDFTIVAVANAYGYNTIGVLLNELWEANARFLQIDLKVEVVRENPLPIENQVPGTFFTVSFFVALMFAPLYGAALIIREKNLSLKHILHLHGVSPFVYWSSAAIPDLILGISAGLLTAYTGLHMNKQNIICKPPFLSFLLLMTVLYIIASTFETYFWYSITRKSSNGLQMQHFYVTAGFFFGTLALLQSPSGFNTSHYSKNFFEIIVECLSLFSTSSCLFYYLQALALASSLGLFTFDGNYLDMNRRLIAMSILAVVYFILLLIIEHVKYVDTKAINQKLADMLAKFFSFKWWKHHTTPLREYVSASSSNISFEPCSRRLNFDDKKMIDLKATTASVHNTILDLVDQKCNNTCEKNKASSIHQSFRLACRLNILGASKTYKTQLLKKISVCVKYWQDLFILLRSSKRFNPDSRIEPQSSEKKFLNSLKGVKGLTDASLSVPAGGIVALVGQNGAGKTTLINALVDYQRLDGGSISFDKVDSVKRTWKYRTMLGWCPQFDCLWNELTVLDHLIILGLLHGNSIKASKAGAHRLIKAMNLTKYTLFSAGNLSGGTKRKLNYIMATYPNKNLVILDEPTTGLDPVSRESLLSQISYNVAGKDDHLVLLSTHSLSEVDGIADFIAVLATGRVIFCGPTLLLKTGYENQQVVKVFFRAADIIELSNLMEDFANQGIDNGFASLMDLLIASESIEKLRDIVISRYIPSCSPFYNEEKNSQIRTTEFAEWSLFLKKALEIEHLLQEISANEVAMTYSSSVFTFTLSVENCGHVFTILQSSQLAEKIGVPNLEFTAESLPLEDIIAKLDHKNDEKTGSGDAL